MLIQMSGLLLYLKKRSNFEFTLSYEYHIKLSPSVYASLTNRGVLEIYLLKNIRKMMNKQMEND